MHEITKPIIIMHELPTGMIEELNALIDKAEAEGKWLRCNYQDLWFSPAQLREENRKGNFRWAAGNWQLRDPQEHVSEARARASAAVAEANRIAASVPPTPHTNIGE